MVIIKSIGKQWVGMRIHSFHQHKAVRAPPSLEDIVLTCHVSRPSPQQSRVLSPKTLTQQGSDKESKVRSLSGEKLAPHYGHNSQVVSLSGGVIAPSWTSEPIRNACHSHLFGSLTFPWQVSKCLNWSPVDCIMGSCCRQEGSFLLICHRKGERTGKVGDWWSVFIPQWWRTLDSDWPESLIHLLLQQAAGRTQGLHPTLLMNG